MVVRIHVYNFGKLVLKVKNEQSRSMRGQWEKETNKKKKSLYPFKRIFFFWWGGGGRCYGEVSLSAFSGC